MDKCFGLNKNNSCTVLKKQLEPVGCGTNQCPFYKTVEEQEQQANKAKERCRRLCMPYGREYAKGIK